MMNRWTTCVRNRQKTERSVNALLRHEVLRKLLRPKPQRLNGYPIGALGITKAMKRKILKLRQGHHAR